MSEALGNTVLLKREDLQPVFSFKLRGAYNKVRCSDTGTFEAFLPSSWGLSFIVSFSVPHRSVAGWHSGTVAVGSVKMSWAST